MRILTFSTLYPNEAQQSHGQFVEHRLSHLLKYRRHDEAKVVAPVPWFPFLSLFFDEFATYAKVPRHESRRKIEVVHPRFLHFPRVSMSVSPFLLAMSSLRAVRKLLTSGWNFDVIDAHYFYPDGVAAVLLARYFKKPVIITARGSDINLFPSYRVPRRLIRWAADSSSAVITVSDALRQKLMGLGVSSNAVTTIQNGVDLDLFRPLDRNVARRQLNIQEGKRVIMAVGNLVELKGHTVLIRAMLTLSANVNLIIVGEGPMKPEYERLIDKLGLPDRVSVIGSVPQNLLPRYYNAVDALVHASSSEGMANVWLEALACGTGVVTSSVGGALEIICNDRVGRVVADRTPEAFAAAITEYLSAAVPSQEIRDYAGQFSWESVCARQAQVFERVVEASQVHTDNRG